MTGSDQPTTGRTTGDPATEPEPVATPGTAATSGEASTDHERRLPPDPAAYDSPRASIARARGLSAPYIAGGRDPDPESGLRQDRFYGRLLLLMVVGLVLAGFLLGILDNLLTSAGTR